ncbi:MAG: aminotransferase class I/II-fold pyridoxal phosphate-dependent enzyme [Prevotella sp.]|nr:aminotransferase class I/II-fold pyridoxal phosphate-dependent enzyme [Prevotella sp.]
MIDGHGDDIYKYKGLVKVNFSSNIYAHADLQKLEQHLSDHLQLICNYPEPEPLSLERVIADESGISIDEVMATNGATEAIYLIAQHFSALNGNGNLTHVIHQPTFSEYGDACRLYGNTISDKNSVGDVFWLCNPNNPTGDVIPSHDILKTADQKQESFFIIDHSYENYTLERMISDSEAVARQNILLLHSMTKRFCVPGLRIGYVVANKQIVSKLKRLRHPWNINALAIEAGKFLIKYNINVLPDTAIMMNEAQRLRDLLNNIEHIDIQQTSTNFMLGRISSHSASELKDFLIHKYGFLIRDASNFDSLDSHYFRIAAQNRNENDAIVAAVSSFVEKDKHHVF